MLFKRRTPPPLGERIRTLLWPRRSWGRSVRYVLHRLWRLQGSPHTIALGCAVGVFTICTPFLGLQLVLAGLLAWLVGGSFFAAMLGTFAGNPLTYPAIWLFTFNLGNVLLGETAAARLDDLRGHADALWHSLLQLSPQAVENAFDSLWPILKPMIVGALPLGLVAALACYVAVRRAVESSQARRRHNRFKLRAA